MDTSLVCHKNFTFVNESESVIVSIPEIVDPSYGMYIWPCAPVLAQYIWHCRDKIRGKHILELGAGTALPGVLAAKLGGKVTLSDATELPECQENCRKSCKANDLSDIDVIGLTWGQFTPDLFHIQKPDIILGSDCFYDPKDFEDILVTVSYLLRSKPSAEFWSTYQERSSEWSIESLLIKWKLKCRSVPLSEFGADGLIIGGIRQNLNHTIQLLIITNVKS